MKKVFFALIVVLLTSRSYAQQPTTTKDQLVGTWKVETLKATSGDKTSYPLGEHPAGYVTMTPERIWLLFVDSARKQPASPTMTDAEAVAMMKTQVAWTGKYVTGEQTADGLKVTAHVDTSSSETITGHDRVYFMRLDGNKLMVKSPGVVVPMTGSLNVVEFELVKSD